MLNSSTMICFYVNESTDKEGRLVGNVVTGSLCEQYSEWIRLHCDALESAIKT